MRNDSVKVCLGSDEWPVQADLNFLGIKLKLRSALNLGLKLGGPFDGATDLICKLDVVSASKALLLSVIDFNEMAHLFRKY